MEHRQRRSRMKRQKTGKSLALTPRDLAIFELLERYRYLRSTSIHAFVGGASATRFKERLGDLYHEGEYLNRPAQQWETAHSRYLPAVYENSDRARDVLAAQGRLADPCPHMPYGTSGAGRQFAHSLMICETLASIELAAKAKADLRFVSWPEILAKAPEETRRSPNPLRLPGFPRRLKTAATELACSGYTVPDAVFGLEYGGEARRSYRFFALEADRGTMPVMRSARGQTSFLEKMIAYHGIAARGVHKSHLGIPNLLVLTVTTSEARKQSMLSALSGAIEDSAMFLFKEVGAAAHRSSATLGAVLHLPWDRAGHSHVDILKPGDWRPMESTSESSA